MLGVKKFIFLTTPVNGRMCNGYLAPGCLAIVIAHAGLPM